MHGNRGSCKSHSTGLKLDRKMEVVLSVQERKQHQLSQRNKNKCQQIMQKSNVSCEFVDKIHETNRPQHPIPK